ncbi:MAG TPA: hypothetical protein VIK93_09720 [Limnochordales bacterium]
MTNDGSPPIYTIGYGRRPAEEILALLHRYGIQELVDVRSQPERRTADAVPVTPAPRRAEVFSTDAAGAHS